jgi:hypothetical protein
VHELTHVLQQHFQKPAPAASLSIAPAGDALEREAQVVADQVMSGRVLPNQCFRVARPSLQTQGAPDSTPEESTPTWVCGPDVTKQVSQALYDTMDAFSDWSGTEKDLACNDLVELPNAPVAWDIVELHEHGWIETWQRYDCASRDQLGFSKGCINTVQVGDQCYYAGSVNYVVFGLMCRLCNMYYIDSSEYDASNWTFGAMTALIDSYKSLWPRIKGDLPADNIQPAKDWAQAGYFGWPGWTGLSMPAGDRQGCSPTCPRKALNKFHVHWVFKRLIPSD